MRVDKDHETKTGDISETARARRKWIVHIFVDDINDDDMDSLDRVAKMPKRTTENSHKSAIQILKELLDRTKDIPDKLTNYQNLST